MIGYVNSLGYTIDDVNRDAGFLRAEKKTTGAGTVASVVILGAGADKYDAMTISIYTDPVTSAGQIKITATTLNEPVTAWGGAQRRQQFDPSPALLADSRTILHTCGSGPGGERQVTLSNIAISNFVRRSTTDGRLVGSFDLANGNDVAISSVVVECSVAGVGTRTTSPLPALGPHQHTSLSNVAFDSAQFPDGAPTCHAADANILR